MRRHFLRHTSALREQPWVVDTTGRASRRDALLILQHGANTGEPETLSGARSSAGFSSVVFSRRESVSQSGGWVGGCIQGPGWCHHSHTLAVMTSQPWCLMWWAAGGGVNMGVEDGLKVKPINPLPEPPPHLSNPTPAKGAGPYCGTVYANEHRRKLMSVFSCQHLTLKTMFVCFCFSVTHLEHQWSFILSQPLINWNTQPTNCEVITHECLWSQLKWVSVVAAQSWWWVKFSEDLSLSTFSAQKFHLICLVKYFHWVLVPGCR